jgi:tetratricopeptide (TPR) repeat protein
MGIVSKGNRVIFFTSIRILRALQDLLIIGASRIVSAVLSNRSLAVMVLAFCALLTIAPWLRPPISRDLRGPHVPFGEIDSMTFMPELASQTPRPWRTSSIATPLLTVIAFGIVVVLLRPRWIGNVFGLLLALSLPATAVALWNYPLLIESFDSELRDRALLRVVFRQHSEHMLSAGTPDRLAALGNKAAQDTFLLKKEHPLILPLRYSVFGTWLVGVALMTSVISQRGSWLRRIGWTGAWLIVGILLTAAATWPRWLAEYHWARAEAFENANQFAAAEASLDSVGTAMPAMKNTWRYWLARGRLTFRQKRPEDQFQAFFQAHQSVLSGDLDRARALVEPYVGSTEGSPVQRDLLSGILAQRAAQYVSEAKYSAAELAWSEATAIAPWKAAYWIGHGAAQLAAAPQRVQEIEQQILPRLSQVGDRMVRSDFYSLAGDAHFAAGSFADARAMYDLAMRLFHLPKFTNVHAQEGRLGM